MTVGYNCINPTDGCTGGYKHNCNVDEKSGQRICPDCSSNVLSITRDIGPDTKMDPPFHLFRVQFGREGPTKTVRASTYDVAFTHAKQSTDTDKKIKKVTPLKT